MLKSIIKKEILHNLTSYKFTIIIILSTVLILVSLFIMYRDYQQRVENYEILQPKSNEPIAIIPPTPLSIIARGLDENLTRSYEIRFGGQIRVGSKQQSVNNLFRLFTTPDLLYVIKVILALCAMLFAFDMVCGEKGIRYTQINAEQSFKPTNRYPGQMDRWFCQFHRSVLFSHTIWNHSNPGLSTRPTRRRQLGETRHISV